MSPAIAGRPKLWLVRTIGTALLTMALVAPAAADLTVQHNVAFNAKKINPYNGGPEWYFSDTWPLINDSFRADIPLVNADPVGTAVEALFGVSLPHLVKLQTGASLSGHANVNVGYYVTAGRLDISYPASSNLNFETEPGTTNYVRANATYGIDTAFLPGVNQRMVPPSFVETEGGLGYLGGMLRSASEYEQPWFETRSPWASAWLDASVDVQAGIFTKVSVLNGLKEWRKDISAGGQAGGRLVEIDPTGLYVAGENIGVNLTQPIGPIPVAGVANLEIRVPNLAVSSVTNGLPAQDPVIRARKEQPLVKLTGSLEKLIPLIGPLLQNQIGPIGYNLLSVEGGPELILYQDMTFTPDPKVRLNFSEPVLIGTSNVPVVAHTFDLDEAIDWTPLFSNSSEVKVVPTYLLNNTFQNETGLSVQLVIDVEALSLTGNFPPFNGTLGPLYTKHITVPLFEGPELFTEEFSIPLAPVTGGRLLVTAGGDPIVLQKSNVDIHPGFGDLLLNGDIFLGEDPENPGYSLYNLAFSRAVDGGPPREYDTTVTGTGSFFVLRRDDDSVIAVARLFTAVEDVVLTDPITSEQFNIGRRFCLEGCDMSAYLPEASPGFFDPENPELGFLYFTELPDDLTFVPGVDLDLTNHGILDRYNVDDDFRQPGEIVYDTEFIDRRVGPSATILARTTEFVPVSDGIERFGPFNAISMNENGDVAFLSTLNASNNTSGYYFADESSKSNFFRSGDPAPGGGGALQIFSPSSYKLNNLGQAAFVMGISNSFSNLIVLRGGSEGLELIARNGQPAPDGSGTFLDFGAPDINDSGQVAFWSRVTHPALGTREAIYIADGTDLTAIARQGDFAPGMSGTMSSFGYLSLNNSGQVAFDVYTTANDRGLYIHVGEYIDLITRNGRSVPEGGIFVDFNNHDLNDAGEVAVFASFVEYFGGPQLFGLFRGSADSMVQIAREGQLAPDQDGTLTWQSFSQFQLNNAGQVAFHGRVDAATPYRAIFLGDGGDLLQIARAGTPSPDGDGQFTIFSGVPQLNNHGHVAFQAFVSNTPGNDGELGVYVHDGTSLVQVIRPGQSLAGSTVSFASLAGINDDMQVAYRANLADGRAVIVRFEPQLYWRNPGSGDWDTDENWSLDFAPRQPYDVFIVTENALTVAGPAADRTVKSLTIGGDDTANATLHLQNAITLTATNGTTIRPNGILSGNGTLIGSVVNEGTIAPGSSPGVLHINADYTQSSSGQLVIEIASSTSYDQLVVGGNVTLGGTLSISLLNGFVPNQGQSFSIFGEQLDAIIGAFESVAFPTFNGLTFSLNQTVGSIMLQVVESIGDFNHDGFVNAADYVLWRKGLGTSYTQDDYDTWRTHFGQFASSGLGATAGLSSSVPEPAPFAILVLAAGWHMRRRPPANRSSSIALRTSVNAFGSGISTGVNR